MSTDTPPAIEQVRPTRTPEFEARLAKRYRAERNFRLLGLGAVAFSVSVLIFLLGNMLLNGIGGFQRAELAVTVDFRESGLSGDAVSLSAPGAVQSLEMQGLPDVVAFSAEQQLGADGAAQISDDGWRDVAAALTRDPALISQSETFHLPATSDLAAGL